MSEQIIDVVREALVKVRGVDPALVVPEAKLTDDLGADSLDAIEIILALEQHYDKEFDGEDIESLETVQDVINLIEQITQ